MFKICEAVMPFDCLNVTFSFRWYRGKILSIRPEREYDVFFVDYGDREWVTEDRIAVMRPEYLQVRPIFR